MRNQVLLRYIPEGQGAHISWLSPPGYDAIIQYDERTGDAEFVRAPVEWMDIRGVYGLEKALRDWKRPIRILIKDFERFLEQIPTELQCCVKSTRNNPNITWVAEIDRSLYEELLPRNGWLNQWYFENPNPVGSVPILRNRVYVVFKVFLKKFFTFSKLRLPSLIGKIIDNAIFEALKYVLKWILKWLLQ